MAAELEAIRWIYGLGVGAGTLFTLALAGYLGCMYFSGQAAKMKRYLREKRLVQSYEDWKHQQKLKN